MAAATSEIDVRSRRHFADMAGLSKAKNRAMMFCTIASTTFGIVMGGLAYYEARVAGRQIERFVVYLDDQNAPVGRPIAVATDWTPMAGVYIDFARRWVRNLRARPADRDTLIEQRKEVIKSTDRRLYTQLQPSMKAADEQLRTASVAVNSISANLIQQDEKNQTAIMLVRWVERIQEPGADSTTWTATVKVASIPPKARLEFDRNPLGLYALEFQITRES